jgi:hypothetical protein
MIITLKTKSDFMPGTLIVDKNKGIYGVVLFELLPYDKTTHYYNIKSLNLSRNRFIRKLQLVIIKKAFKY